MAKEETIIVELEREDALRLVKAYYPYYDIHEELSNLGHFVGGFHDKWVWNDDKVNELDIDELCDLYIKCKQSWKNGS